MSFFTSRAARLRRRTEKYLAAYNQPTPSFFVLIGLASAIAAAGLLLDNVSIVIGAMVVAPLITPIFELSLSLLVFRIQRIGMSLLLIFFGTVLGIIVAVLIGVFVIFLDGAVFDMTTEIIVRTKPHFLYFLVAFFSGVAGAYAYSRPKILQSITGIAISVALIPPLAVTGLQIATHNYFFAQQSLLLYIFNLTGIIFGSVLVFFILGFDSKK